jgi:hypothetical protein
MKKEKSQKFLYISFFLFMQALIITKNLINPGENSFLWFCDFVPLLLIIGYYFDWIQFTKSLINIGFIAQNLFVIDILFNFILGHSLFGFSTKLFESGHLQIFFSFLIHIFPLNLAFIHTYKIKNKFSSLVYSFIFLSLIYIMTLYLSNPLQDINYVFNPGANLNIPYYSELWIPIVFIVVVIPTYFLQLFVYELFKYYQAR